MPQLIVCNDRTLFIRNIFYRALNFKQTLFGILGVLAGLCSLTYPETAKTDYMTSLDEAEEYYRNNMKVLKLCKKR